MDRQMSDTSMVFVSVFDTTQTQQQPQKKSNTKSFQRTTRSSGTIIYNTIASYLQHSNVL